MYIHICIYVGSYDVVVKGPPRASAKPFKPDILARLAVHEAAQAAGVLALGCRV